MIETGTEVEFCLEALTVIEVRVVVRVSFQ